MLGRSDRPTDRRARGWQDLPLRAQGLMVMAVPVMGLIAAAGLVAQDAARGGTPSLSVATLSVLVLAIVTSTAATIAFMSNLARRVNLLTDNAERLAREAPLEEGGAGSDELARAQVTLVRASEVLDSRRRQLEEARTSLEHMVSSGPMVMFAGELTANLDDSSPLGLDYISANSARVMGHSPVAVLRDPTVFVGLVHPDDLDRFLDAAHRAAGDGRSQVPIEVRIRHLDGSWRTMEVMVRGHEREARRILGYAFDVSARRQAQEAQRQSESRLQAFLDNSSALISLKDPFGRYQFANRALADLLDRSAEDLRGSDDFELWPDAAPGVRGRDQQVLVTRRPMQSEDEVVLPDGVHTFLSVRFPLLDGDGMPVAVGSISTDITELKHAIASVAARERVLSTVIGASPDIITILEEDSTIRTTSVAFERIFGYPTRALVDQRLVDVIHPDDRADTAARLGSLRDGTAERTTLRFRGRTRQRVWVTIESHAQLITGPDGENDGVVMVSRDISDQIALEGALRRAKEEAERASDTKSRFLSRVSHELRTPLNAMLGFAQLLELESLEEPCGDYVLQITKAGDHLLALINEVLDIARIESDELRMRIEPIVAGDAVREVLELTAPLAGRAGVRLQGAETATVELLADPQRLLQVLINLVSNAIKYNRPEGRVDVTVDADPDTVRITVTDTGRGLAEDDIDRLFVPFDRLGLESTGIEGTGVGLSLSKGLTERMGGTLSVTSTLGEGSSFSVTLPAAAPAPRPEAALEADPPIAGPDRTPTLAAPSASPAPGGRS